MHFLTNGKYLRESHFVWNSLLCWGSPPPKVKVLHVTELRLDIWLAQKYFGFDISNFPFNTGSFIYDNKWCFLEYDTLAGNSCAKARCSMGKLTYGRGPRLERTRFLLSQICSHQPAPLPLACPWMHLQNFELKLLSFSYKNAFAWLCWRICYHSQTFTVKSQQRLWAKKFFWECQNLSRVISYQFAHLTQESVLMWLFTHSPADNRGHHWGSWCLP